MSIIIITPPTQEPVDVADVKLSARVDGTDMDAQIALLIKAQRLAAEGRLQRKLVTQTLELVLDDFPDSDIDLLLPDVSEIVSVTYLDAAGAQAVVPSSNYVLDNASHTSWLLPAAGYDWPATADTSNALRVRFKSGFGDATKVPEDIKLWIITQCVRMLQWPDGYMSNTLLESPLDRLLDPYKIWRVA